MLDALTTMLAALAKLSSTDRNAVLRHLSADERAALTKLMAQSSAAQAAAPATSKPTQPTCSPWLAKRLAEILEDHGQRSVTSATRVTVRDFMSGQAP